MYKTDTICAIATGLGRSAIGMIRISGPEAVSIVNKVFEGRQRVSEMKTYTAAFGKIVDGGRVIDEAIVLVMLGKHTYTTEDTVEIDLHGGPFVIRQVLELLVKNGARVAEPGEFTKRAFLGGRIDMTEAEAVMDVINAESGRALDASVGQLTGKLREEIVELREKVLYHTAYIESALDDPENYSLDGFSDTLRVEITGIIQRIDRLLATADEGRILREGISTAIVGKPNVGKSSMLNQLIGEERAIVTEIEGTTRDTLEEMVDIGGATLRLIDTAGIRDTKDVVEKIGVEKARDTIQKADLVMLLLDVNELKGQDVTEIISAEDSSSLSSKKIIVVINKMDKINPGDTNNESEINDIENKVQEILKDAGIQDYHIVYTSAATGQGIDELKCLIKDMFLRSEIDYNNQVFITRARHKSALMAAKQSLEQVIDSIDAGVGEDFLTIDLMDAYESMGDIIGETLQDDLADKIFSEFCMGK